MKGLRAPSKMLQKINNQVNNQQEQNTNTQTAIEEEINIDQFIFDIQQQELQQYINSLQKIENKQYIIDRIDVICSRQKLQQEYADSLDYFHRYSQKIFRQLKYFYKCQIKDEFSTKIQTMKRNQLRSINKTLETYCTNQYKLVQDYYDSSYNNTVENMYRIIQQLRQLTSKAIETALEPKTPFHLMNVVTYEDLVKLNGIDLTIDNIDMYRLYEAYRYIVVEDYEKRSNKAIALLETVYQEQKDLGNPLCYQVQNLIEIEKQFQVYVFQAESRFQLQILFDVYNEMRIRLFVKVTNEKLLQQAVLVNLKLFQQLFSRDYEQVQHWIQNAGQIDNKRKDVVKELNLVYNELQKTRYAMKGTDSLEKLEALVKAHLLRDVPYKLYQITGNLDTNNNIELDYYPDQDFENIEIDFQLDNFEVKHTLDYNNHDTTNRQHQNSQESSQLFDEDEDNQENQETIDEVNIKLKELQILPQNEMILKQQIEDSFDNNEEDFDDGGFDDDEEDYNKEKEQEAERLRLEEERIQKEQEEKQRLEEERIQKEQEEKQRLEEERIQKEQEEKQRLEQERIQKEQEEKQRLEQERIQKEQEEKQRLEEERIQKEQEEKQRLEEERIQKEQEEKQLEEETNQKEQEEKQRLEENRSNPERTGREAETSRRTNPERTGREAETKEERIQERTGKRSRDSKKSEFRKNRKRSRDSKKNESRKNRKRSRDLKKNESRKNRKRSRDSKKSESRKNRKRSRDLKKNESRKNRKRSRDLKKNESRKNRKRSRDLKKNESRKNRKRSRDSKKKESNNYYQKNKKNKRDKKNNRDQSNNNLLLWCPSQL
ncbi:Calponin_-like proteiny domain-containing protein [Hexamita inflata]|uniref:Calponin -like proteiny domain-containing protein n=1 Tax=Hexamita inflata TaxID=28002 RepID=A0AA86NDX2_9EUKA|nr:Calponin -like proteiny domain-containing protein [Hexamita inflata]